MNKKDEMYQGRCTILIPKQIRTVISNTFNVHSKHKAANMTGEK